ncbi:hypothetical protein D3C80_1603490 [compost metagenome]
MGAPAADQAQAVFTRQAEIDNRDVRRMFLQEIIGFLGIFRSIDLMAHLAHLYGKVVAQQTVIFNNQYSHGGLLWLCG